MVCSDVISPNLFLSYSEGEENAPVGICVNLLVGSPLDHQRLTSLTFFY